MKRNLALLSVLFLSITAIAGCSMVSAFGSTEDELKTILTKMNQTAGNFNAAQAGFTSVTYQKLVDEKDTQSGHIYFRRKNRVVEAAFEIGGPAPKQVVYQNGILRVYEKKINQVTERNVEKSHADVDAFLSLGFGASGDDLVRDYGVKFGGWETIDGAKTAKLELAPKNEKLRNTYSKILLWIDPEKDILLQQQFFENSGDYRLVHYTNMKLSNKLPDDKFQLKTSGKVTTVQAQ